MEDDANKSVEASLFEGMFQRALQPTGAFEADLRAAGFDLRQIEPRYATEVWRKCLDAARQHLFPTLTPEQAYRQMGRLFIDGFFQTIIGRMFSAAFPLMGPAAVIKRLPKMWKAARKDIQVEPVEEGERRWRVLFRDRHVLPDFIAGLVEAAGARTKSEVAVVVDVRRDDGFELLITW